MSTGGQILFGALNATVGALGVGISPGSIYQNGTTATITTPSVLAMGVGGTAPYTYAWTKVSGAAINIGSAATAVTNFNAATMVSPSDRIATFRVTVTDATLATSTSDIIVECERF